MMPKMILHRGLFKGPDKIIENFPLHIQHQISIGFDCEIDLWYEHKDLYLGHDYPVYKITLDFLVDNRAKLWIHCKNIDALSYLNNQIINLNYFWHEKDRHTLTSQKFIWQEGYHNLTSKTIVVDTSPNPKYDVRCYGLCVNYITNTNSK